ncbi:DUF3429 domain-containing protein [Aquabacterium olei]|uniref:DUF3429 domain-containing protein n=1 Tax=Aquabacterium olei TaxID=1296669 RepID=UPI001FE79FA4|nr:DUF3429 domain-containing protein [Aquabacterium olei]
MSTTPPTLTLPTDPHHHSEPGELANKLGYAGLIPFVAGALFVWLLVGRVEEEPFIFVVRALTSYAALIVSFLGGIPWGLVMLRNAAGEAELPSHHRALWAGIAFSLAAWVALLMPPHAGLVVLGGLLIGCYLIDRKRYPELGAAGWLTLRFRLTVFASLSCFLAAAQI